MWFVCVCLCVCVRVCVCVRASTDRPSFQKFGSVDEISDLMMSNAEGEFWKVLRSTVSPTFSTGKLKLVSWAGKLKLVSRAGKLKLVSTQGKLKLARTQGGKTQTGEYQGRENSNW